MSTIKNKKKGSTPHAYVSNIDGIGDLLSSIIAGGLWGLFSPIVGFSYAAILSFIAMILLLLRR